MKSLSLSEEIESSGGLRSEIRTLRDRFEMGWRASLIGGAMLLVLLVLFAACHEQQKPPPAKATYVGRDRCRDCHPEVYEAFEGSDHDLAMAPATEENVLGDFDDASLTHFGVTSRFLRREGKYFVITEGAEGELVEYAIKYTFGVRPLQQYLVEFPGGRLQCLPLCWDSRPAEEGGQRWFHLYPDERISPNDLLHWTRTTQNWNYMCAECHSTNLQKNYDRTTNSYQTTWSEIEVSCEACHGPGSQHIEWAESSPDAGSSSDARSRGLRSDLGESAARVWQMNLETGNAVLSAANGSARQIDLCGRCHSHRTVISEDYDHARPLSASHQVSLLTQPLYFPDGQIKEEVYVYGSFLQSKMYQAGVLCTDCHDPHSTELLLDGDGLCLRCHLPQKYATKRHHFHEAGAKVECVDCHMAERTYMVIDGRRDHSFRVPRPDLSEKLRTPNACNQCHVKRSTQWAADRFKQWYPVRVAQNHFGETFFAAQRSDPSAAPELLSLIANQKTPAIVRATAVSLLERFGDRVSLDALRSAATDADPLVRTAVVAALSGQNPENRRSLLIDLLNDPALMVRAAAARLLAAETTANLTEDQTAAFEQALLEYERMQAINADYPSARLNLANLYLDRREIDRAVAELREAIALEPAFTPTYVNLADIYRVQNRDSEGRELLLHGLEFAPDDPSLHHALGLLYVRSGKHGEAIPHLARAAQDRSGDPRYRYVYAIALNSAGQTEQAIALLEQTLEDNPFEPYLLQALIAICRQAGAPQKAQYYRQKLAGLQPERSKD